MPEASVISPAEEMLIDVSVFDYQSNPLAAEGNLCLMHLICIVLLFVVDEAVLDLAGYSLQHPLLTFLRKHLADTALYHNLSSILLRNLMSDSSTSAEVEDLEDEDHSDDEDTDPHFSDFVQRGVVKLEAAHQFQRKTSLLGGGFGLGRGRKYEEVNEVMSNGIDNDNIGALGLREGANDSIPITRQDFDPLCAFDTQNSNENGIARFTVKAKDSVTRYRFPNLLLFLFIYLRIYAVAAHGIKSFGIGSNNVITSLPVMVRPSLPRFLNYGDRNVLLNISIQNQIGRTITVTIASRTVNATFANGTNFTGIKELSLPPNGRKKVQFKVEPVSPGFAQFEFISLVKQTNDNNNATSIS